MQKLLHRTALAKRQAERRSARRAVISAKENKVLRRQSQVQINASIRSDIKAERTARRQDWFLGPLAPRRDVGEHADDYGAIEPTRLRAVEKAQWKDWGIVAGDRVVVIRRGHREENKIGTVKEISDRREECTVEGLNRTNVVVPKYMLAKEADKTPVRQYELPFHLSAVRLVAKLPQPDTGVIRDVVINELEVVKEHYLPGRGIKTKERYIAGLVPRTKIPFPEKEREEWDDNDCDSLRIEVEEQTWTPTLLEPPMPMSILDELRNKFGKFRSRHDVEYIAKVERAEREAMRRKRLLATKIVSPLKEFHRKERAEKRALGKPELGETMLAGIGQIMAARQESSIFKTS